MSFEEHCVICLDHYVKNDINILLDCGHQYHYFCSLNLNDKIHCCICKKIIISKSKYLWIEKLNFFEDSFDFKSLFSKCKNDYKTINTMIRDYNDNNMAILYENTIQKFISTNIKIFYTKIIEACNSGLTKANLCIIPQGYKFNNVPFIFLIYGPYFGRKYFFRKYNLDSLLKSIEIILNKSFSENIFKVFFYKSNNLNYHIAAKWKFQ